MKKLLLLTALLFSSAQLLAQNVVIKTSAGDIEVALYTEKAPHTTKNFLRYVDDGWYSNTIFHRVINGFMIQGGGFTTDAAKKEPYAAISNESHNGVENKRGTIAMARTNDPNSATSQFFINHNDNASLNFTGTKDRPLRWGYAVFGEVTKGMDVVDSIAKSKTSTATLDGFPAHDVPVRPIIIKDVVRVNDNSD